MRISCLLLVLLALSVVFPTTARWLQKKGDVIPVRTAFPSIAPESWPPSLAPTRSPSSSPTSSPTTDTPTSSPTTAAPTSPPTTVATSPLPMSNPPTSSPLIAIESIPIYAFTLGLVVPAQTRRRLQAPFNSNVLLTVTQDHIGTYLMGELNCNVDDVKLTSVEPSRITFLQSSTVVMEEMSGYVLMDGAPSSNTVNALILQSLEGQELWKLFSQLRESEDPVLAKLQQVSLVETSTTTSDPQVDGGVSTLVIGIVVAAGTLTFLILMYMGFSARTNGLEIKTKKEAGTPDTNASSQFFPDQERSLGARSVKNYAQNDDALSVSSAHVSNLSSALHSIQEISREDEEEEDKEQPGTSRLWESLSEIEVQEDSILVNMPPLIQNESVENANYFCINKIMAIETNYSTEHGTEVARREVVVKKKPKKKGNWMNQWRRRSWHSMNDSQCSG